MMIINDVNLKKITIKIATTKTQLLPPLAATTIIKLTTKLLKTSNTKSNCFVKI